MLRTYQGYFSGGRFISFDIIPVLEKKRVIITVLDDKIHEEFTQYESAQYERVTSERQRLAFEKYFRAIDAADDEDLTEADFTELENNRLNFRRDLDL